MNTLLIIVSIVIFMVGVMIGAFAMALVAGRSYQKGWDDAVSQMDYFKTEEVIDTSKTTRS